MSQFFDQASLVMVPSGYKTGKVYSQKPLSTDGELTFTRASSATRVGPDGLIEKVRTNLVISSGDISTQSTYWVSNQSGSTTQNAAVAPDGTTTAAQITSAGSSYSGVSQASISVAAVPHTYSCYLKAVSGTPTIRLTFFDGVTFHQGNFAITSEWVRYSFTFTPLAGSFAVYNSCSSVETWLAWGAQLEVSDFGATDYIATTTAAVSVGPVANLPRLDYLGSSCPRLLLEPQRTNLALYSEQFDNAAWTKSGATITANATTSPDGYVNADKLVENSSLSSHYVNVSNLFTVDGSLRAWSLFVKEGERRYIFITNVNTINSDINCVVFDTRLGVFTNTNDPTLIVTRKVQALENGWYRIDFTSAVNNGAYDNFFIGISSTSNMSGVSYLGDGTSGLYIYGAQLELGAYATSYINTLGSASTRGSDACSKTGISSLIGQTEGTIYWEGVRPEGGNDTSAVSLSDTTTNNEVTFRFTAVDTVEFYLRSGGSQTVASTYTGADLNQNTKIAFAYKANDVAIYVNGTLVVLDTSATVPVSLTAFKFSRGNDGTPMIASVSQALLFKTRLTNAQLAELTTL